MLDIDSLMAGLAARRPIFHSEADFQHALAWQIHETCPDSDLRLEREQFLPGTAERMATDIWIRLPDAVVAIELKYTNRALQIEWTTRFLLFVITAHNHPVGMTSSRTYSGWNRPCACRIRQTTALPFY